MAISLTADRKLNEDARSSASLPKTSAEYSVELVNREEDLRRLENPWNRLSEVSNEHNVFAGFDWYRAWNHRFLREDHSSRRQPWVLVIKKRDTVTGIAPLILRRVSRLGFTIRKLEFSGPQADYNDLLVGSPAESKEQLQSMAEYLADTQDQWDLADLRDLRDTGIAMEEIAQTLEGAGLAYRVRPERKGYPFLKVDAPWPQWLGRQSYGSRRTFRKQHSRLGKLSSLGLRIRLIERPHLEADLLLKLVALERQKRIQARPLPPLIAKYQDVFQDLFETLGARGSVLVAVMELGPRLVAWQVWFRCGSKLWGYQTAYDHAHARLSPGTMLVPAVMDYAFEHGYEELDFLRGNEPYKMRWANESHRTFRLEIWSRRWKSRARKFVYLDVKEAVYRRLSKDPDTPTSFRG